MNQKNDRSPMMRRMEKNCSMIVSSMTECTGLIPAAPVSEPEIDSYSAIYDIPLAEDEKAAQHGLQNKKQKNEQGHSHPNTGR